MFGIPAAAFAKMMLPSHPHLRDHKLDITMDCGDYENVFNAHVDATCDNAHLRLISYPKTYSENWVYDPETECWYYLEPEQ